MSKCARLILLVPLVSTITIVIWVKKVMLALVTLACYLVLLCKYQFPNAFPTTDAGRPAKRLEWNSICSEVPEVRQAKDLSDGTEEE